MNYFFQRWMFVFWNLWWCWKKIFFWTNNIKYKLSKVGICRRHKNSQSKENFRKKLFCFCSWYNQHSRIWLKHFIESNQINKNCICSDVNSFFFIQKSCSKIVYGKKPETENYIAFKQNKNFIRNNFQNKVKLTKQTEIKNNYNKKNCNFKILNKMIMKNEIIAKHVLHNTY